MDVSGRSQDAPTPGPIGELCKDTLPNAFVTLYTTSLASKLSVSDNKIHEQHDRTTPCT